MRWIGLTGGISSGKSSVAEILRKLGHFVMDADQLAREVVNPHYLSVDGKRGEGLRKIVELFGPSILDKDQKLDRKKLGQWVFSDPQKLLELESILHPLIREEALKLKIELERKVQNAQMHLTTSIENRDVSQEVEESCEGEIFSFSRKLQGKPYLAFYDVPLLFEKNMQDQFDAILLVTCDPLLQRERLKARDSLTDPEIEQRLLSQIPLHEKEKRTPFVIVNNKTMEELNIETLKVLEKMYRYFQ